MAYTLTDTGGLEQAIGIVDTFTQAFNEAGGDQLRDNLSAGTSTRTGVHYAQQPRRSSAPGEMPQEQRGVLKGMVKTGKLAPCRYWWGLHPVGKDQEDQAVGLELGNPRRNLVARAPGTRTGLDVRTHKRGTEAGLKTVR